MIQEIENILMDDIFDGEELFCLAKPNKASFRTLTLSYLLTHPLSGVASLLISE